MRWLFLGQDVSFWGETTSLAWDDSNWGEPNSKGERTFQLERTFLMGRNIYLWGEISFHGELKNQDTSTAKMKNHKQEELKKSLPAYYYLGPRRHACNH